MAFSILRSACLSNVELARESVNTKRAVIASRARASHAHRSTERHVGVVCSATLSANVVNDFTRRQLFFATGAGALCSFIGLPALANEEVKKVFVAGATGQTGRRVVEQLRAQGIAVRAGVRSIKKAEELGLAFTRVGTPPVELVVFDVTGSQADLVAAIGDADAVICATGFSQTVSNWAGLKPGSSVSVDKDGTIKLVNASKQAGVKHFVLVSSLLTNAAACGQTNNSNYKVLQTFGGILDSKREAEVALQVSGLDYTVVRPGGLSNEIDQWKTDPDSRGIIMAGADTFFGEEKDPGREISRDQVAEVAIEALFRKTADKKIVEIMGATGKGTPKKEWFLVPSAPSKGCASSYRQAFDN